jgi:hypothetical protein
MRFTPVPDDVITGIMADRIAQVRAGSEAALAALGDLLLNA